MKPGNSESGVTLVELLIVIALLAVMASYAVLSFGQIGRLRKIEADIARDAEIDAVVAHFRREIESARFLLLAPKEDEPAGIAFIGEARRLALVTDGDRRLETGGLTVSAYALEASGDSNILSNYRTVFRPDEPIASYSGVEPVRILRDLDAITFRFFGQSPEGETLQWSSDWQRTDGLPQLIEVTLTFDPEARRRPLSLVAQVAMSK